MLIFILGRLDMSLGASCGPIGRLEPDPVDPAANKHMKEKKRRVEERGREGEGRRGEERRGEERRGEERRGEKRLCLSASIQ